MANFDDMKLAVEALSGGKNTVLFDDMGMPSIVFPFAKQKYSDLMAGGTQETFPCFRIENEEKDVIYISKFLNIVVNDRAYSLPMKDPRANINFDEALRVCRNKGSGWGLMPGCLWQAVALWCKKNGTIPHGNNNYGQASENAFEKGVPTLKDGSGRILRTATGSGPVTWNHNFQDSGISDLNGDVWEWTADTRLFNGEIQIIPYGNCLRPDCNMGPSSTEWKAIMPDGTLVAPGTPGTLKYDNSVAGDATKTDHGITGPVILSTTREHPMYTGGDTNDYYAGVWNQPIFQGLTAKSGVSVPQILKAYGLFPVDAELGGDGFWCRNYGERLPLRGGSYWDYQGRAGVFALDLTGPRAHSTADVGFRAAFVGL